MLLGRPINKCKGFMVVLTRGAARRLGADADADGAASVLALRESVAGKADAVWRHRGLDAYSLSGRVQTDGARPQVDHALEVQLCEVAFVRAFGTERARASSMATAQASELLRGVFNDVANLNVTSARINQSKKGPFTAAMNRLGSERTFGLRMVPIEQLARQGRARWLVDNGNWARIEETIVESFDSAERTVRVGGVDAMQAAAVLVESSFDELHQLLEKLQIL